MFIDIMKNTIEKAQLTVNIKGKYWLTNIPNLTTNINVKL